MSTERTLVLVKPDGVQRGLVGEIVGRFEHRGLQLRGLKLMRISQELAAKHYEEHQGKPFYPGLVEFITSSPVVAMVWEGPGAVAMVRLMMGATNPANAAPGTIRGDLAVSMGMNVIHGSDSPENGMREAGIFFSEDELVEWRPTAAVWLKDE